MHKQFFFRRFSLMIVIFTLVLTGCSNANDKDNTNTATRTIEHLEGTITIPDNPQRIVDISGLTEELLILAIQPLGTANTDPFDNSKIDPLIKDRLNDDAVALGYYGGGAINMEEIIALKPDIILTNIRHNKINDKLAKIAPTVVMKDNEFSTDWRGRFIHLGEVFKREDDVNNWLADYDNKAQQLHDEITARTKDETFAVLEAGPAGYRIYADAGVGDIMFNDLQLLPVKGTPKDVWGADMSLEGLSTIDPDHIVLLYSDTQLAELEASALWQNMRAVTQGHVYKVTNEQQYAEAFTARGKSNLVDIISKMILEATK